MCDERATEQRSIRRHLLGYMRLKDYNGMRNALPAFDFLGALAARGTAALAAFGANILLARLLGPGAYGRYMTILSAALVSAGIAAYGVGPLLTREIAGSQPVDRLRVLSGAFRWSGLLVFRVAIAMVLILCAWLMFGPAAPANDWGTRAGAMSIVPLAAGATLVGAALAGQSRVAKGESTHNLIKNIVLVSGVLAFYFFGIKNVTGIIWLQAAGLFLAFVVGIMWVAHAEGMWIRKFLGRVLRGGWPESGLIRRRWSRSARNFFVITSATLLLGRLDVILVNALSRQYEAGIYAAAVRVGQVAAIIGMVWVAWLQPRVAGALRRTRRRELSKVLAGAWAGVFVMTCGVAIVGWLLAPRFGSALGNGYAAVVAPLRLLLIGYVAWSIGVPAYVLLGMSRHEGLLARAIWLQVVVTLAATAALTPAYGAMGAIEARVLGFALATSAFLGASWRVWPSVTGESTDDAIERV